VDSDYIRVGTQSQLAWKIQYPASVTDIVDLSTETVIPKEDLQMRVRILGSKLHLKDNNGKGNNLDGVDESNPAYLKQMGITTTGPDDEISGKNLVIDQPVEVYWSKNKAAWERLFYGTQSTLVSTSVVLETVVATGDTVDFGARGFLTSWLPLYCTSSDCRNLVILKNGDPVPHQISSKQYGQVVNFLKPYLSTDAKTVRIGARDLLILVELDQTEPLAVGFDYQDLGMLVTFD
jgi:hypothetical protein